MLQGYVTGAAFQIEVGQSSDETIQTAADIVRAHRTALKVQAPGAPLDIEIWADQAGHLLRLSVPAQNLEVVREDLASVAARRVTATRPNDELVRIPANGFDLAGTLSKPANAGKTPLPAAILVSGSGPQDRDETVFGIPVSVSSPAVLPTPDSWCFATTSAASARAADESNRPRWPTMPKIWARR